MGYKHNIDDIIKKGAELFRKNGYHNVGINQILKECGIPKGSFYNFFESKEDFAKQVVNYYGNSSKSMITSFLGQKELSPLARLKSFYRMLIDSNIADGLDAGCLINMMSNEVGAQNEAIAQSANDGFMSWIEVLATCVVEGQATGEIIDTYTPHEIAEYLHAGTYGAFPRMKVTNSTLYFDNWYTMTFDFISK